MQGRIKICCWLLALLFTIPLVSFSSIPVKSMVIFGDSLSDTGNTTHLLKSLRQEESASFITAPFKIFVINKMIEFANYYYVPQLVLDSGIATVNDFFDNEVAPYIVNLIAQIRLVPLLPGKPYWQNRFSNGRVWNEYLANMLSIQKSDEDVYLNKAFGGSWAATYDNQLTVWNLIRHPLGMIKTLIVGKLIPPSLGLTVQAYLLEHTHLNEKTIYFIYSGGNDYINALSFKDKYNPMVMSAYVDNVISGVNSAVSNLVSAGARRFIILGIPHVGNLPKFVNTNDKEILNAATDQHNALLRARLEEWKLFYPEVDFLFINTQEYLARALDDPQQFGFTNVTDACIDVKFPMFKALTHSPFANNLVLRYTQAIQDSDKHSLGFKSNYHKCDQPDDYLFWDEIHPSTKAHSYLAYDICMAMKEHGYAVNCKKIKSS